MFIPLETCVGPFTDLAMLDQFRVTVSLDDAALSIPNTYPLNVSVHDNCGNHKYSLYFINAPRLNFNLLCAGKFADKQSRTKSVILYTNTPHRENIVIRQLTGVKESIPQGHQLAAARAQKHY